MDKYGECPWCKRKNQALHFVLGSYDHGTKIWAGFICMDCLKETHGMDWYSNVFCDRKGEVKVYEDHDD